MDKSGVRLILALAMLSAAVTPLPSRAAETGPWQAVESMPTAAAAATSTLLKDGRVLVTGGAAPTATASASIFDPATGSWTALPPMSTPRSEHDAAMLSDGRVLVAGGTDGKTILKTAEIFNPVTQQWTPTSPLIVGRRGLRLTTGKDGSIFVTGGMGGPQCGSVAATVERFDPATGIFEDWGGLVQRRMHHTATALPSGQILIMGGLTEDGRTYRRAALTVEVFDPIRATSRAGLPRVTGGVGMTVTPLPDGRALVIAGCCVQPNFSYGPVTQEELGNDGAYVYDPVADRWTPTLPMHAPRAWHTATTLPGGRILVAGGVAVHPGTQSIGTRKETFLSVAEVYDPSSNGWLSVGDLLTARAQHIAAPVPGGAIVAGGLTGADTWRPVASAERFVGGGAESACCPTAWAPDTGTVSVTVPAVPGDQPRGGWTDTGRLNEARWRDNAIALDDRRVMVIGGYGSGLLQTYEIYDSTTRVWTTANVPWTARTGFALTKLNDGRVLLTGGYASNRADIYDPTTNKWTAAASMLASRDGHAAVTLADGRVLVAAGQGSACQGMRSTTEIYNPTTNSWTPGPNMNGWHAKVTGVRMADGRVFAYDSPTGPDRGEHSVEIFDPETSRWQLGRPPPVGNLQGQTLTALKDGTVLAVGGCCARLEALVTGLSYPSADALLFDPKSMMWRPTPPMTTSRHSHTATLLPSGRVVVTGGIAAWGLSLSRFAEATEIYDPSTQRWSAGEPMPRPRHSHTSVVLGDGSILHAGGASEVAFTTTPQRWAEIFTI